MADELLKVLEIIDKADMIIASEDAYFYQAFINLGLIPDTGGLYTLMKVMELAITGRRFTVTEAHQLGIVYKIVPLEELVDETITLAKDLANGPSDAYAEMKRMFINGSTQILLIIVVKKQKLSVNYLIQRTS